MRLSRLPTVINLFPVVVAVLLAGLMSVPTTPTTAAQSINGLQETIADILARNGVPGAGIAIVNRDGVIWAGGAGLADIQQRRPVTADTIFRLGSVTKNITAMTVMRQVERGRLSLDDRVHDVAPDASFANPWEATSPVRISNLLEHTAGFDFVRFNDDLDTQPMGRSIADALAVNPAARNVRWPPGTRMAYSNEGFTLAASVLEKLSNQSFDDIVRDEVFSPLGMSGSAMRLTPDLAPRLATGYTAAGAAQAYLEDMQRPAANMLASPQDMAAYLLMLLQRGKLNDGSQFISDADLSRMEQRRTLAYTGPAEQYGLGTDTAQYPGGFIAHGHVGVQSGFKASLRYFPEQGVGWAVLVNRDESDEAVNSIESELLSFVMAGAQPSAPPQATNPSPELLTGYYRDAAPDQEFLAVLGDIFGGTDVQLRPDGLWERSRNVGGLRSLFSSGTWVHLVPTDANGSFRHDGETIASRFFSGNDAGVQVLVTQMGYFEKDNQLFAEARRVLIQLALLGVVSGLVLVPLCLLRALNVALPGPLSGIPGLTVLVPAALLALVAVSTWFILMRTNETLAEVNATTVWAFVASIVFPLLAVATLALSVRALFDSNVGLVYRAYLMLFGIAGGCLTVVEWAAHWIALRTWAW